MWQSDQDKQRMEMQASPHPMISPQLIIDTLHCSAAVHTATQSLGVGGNNFKVEWGTGVGLLCCCCSAAREQESEAAAAAGP